MREHKHEDKKTRFNHFTPIVCGVPRCDKDSTPHINRFSTKSHDFEHGKLRKISGDLRINKIFFIAILELRTYRGNNINSIKYNNKQKNYTNK